MPDDLNLEYSHRRAAEKRKNPPKDPCQKYACAIQDCLKANNYDEKKCEAAILALNKCCEGLKCPYDKMSVVCEGMKKRK